MHAEKYFKFESVGQLPTVLHELGNDAVRMWLGMQTFTGDNVVLGVHNMQQVSHKVEPGDYKNAVNDM